MRPSAVIRSLGLLVVLVFVLVVTVLVFAVPFPSMPMRVVVRIVSACSGRCLIALSLVVIALSFGFGARHDGNGHGDLGDEDSFAAAEGDLEGPGGRREVGGPRGARQVGITRRVHGNAEAAVIAAAAEVGGVDEGGAGGIELRHERVEGAAAGSQAGVR